MSAEVTEVLVKRYRCPHCRKLGSKRSRAVEHAKSCYADPAQRACPTCLYDDREGCQVGIERMEGESFVRNCAHWQGRPE